MLFRFGVAALAFVFPGFWLTAQTASSKPGSSSVPAAETSVIAARSAAQVPRLVRFSGSLENVDPEIAVREPSADAAAPAKVVGVTFSLYAEQSGGVPLWSEVQNVRVDAAGHYTVELGSTKADGLPAELFSSAQAQWLGVQQAGQAEQPRIMLVSVPYALKAADAETFGGKPPSAYMAARGSEAASVGVNSARSSNGTQAPPPAVGGSGAANYVAVWTSGTNLGSSQIYQASNNNVGIGTTTPQYPLVVHAHTGGPVVEVTQSGGSGVAILGYSYATTGGNLGVLGKTASQSGVGVEGQAAATSGNTFGMDGVAASSAGTGVFGEATSLTGNTFGVAGRVSSPTGIAVNGESVATHGFAIGVAGSSDSTSGVGILGNATAATGSAFGVKGTSDSVAGVGIYGIATSDTGVNYGMEGTNASPDGAGVFGQNNAVTGNAVGVWGMTDSPGGIGTYGVGVDASAVGVGESPIGVWGTTNQSGGIGVLGTTDGEIAVAGSNNAPSVATADFINEESTRIDAAVLVTRGSHYDGLCLMDVSGNLDCTGSKSAVVPVDSGTRKVALYAVEAPENWFEDIGSGQLAGGSAVVQLESTFAQTVDSDIEYHVFLTPKGDCKGLYVTNETAGSFEVRELGGGTASIGFDYRIVARRKGYENIRLADKTELFAAAASERKVISKNKPGTAPAHTPPTTPGKRAASPQARN